MTFFYILLLRDYQNYDIIQFVCTFKEILPYMYSVIIIIVQFKEENHDY